MGILKIHGLTTSGVNTSWYLFYKLENAANLYCENNYNLQK